MGRIKTLLGDQETEHAARTFRLRVVKTVFSREVIREDMPAYLATERFTSPSQVFEMFRDLVRETKEHFLALHLDGKNRIVCLDRVSTGSLNQSVVHPREVFKAAVHMSAAAILLVHNHPTGDPTPSREDVQITKRLKEVGDVLGIAVLDHIIIGDGRYSSFVEMGLF